MYDRKKFRSAQNVTDVSFFVVGGMWRTAKRDSTGYCSSPPSTSSSLHGLLFIYRRPPPASTCDCSSMGSCSSSLHRTLRHQLHQPSPRGSCSTTPPRATVHPALHRLLFIQPSTGWSCSSSPPRGPVHPPARSIGVLFIQRQRPLLPRGPVHPTPTGNCSSKPPNNAHCSSRGSIDRLQLAAVAKESLNRV